MNKEIENNKIISKELLETIKKFSEAVDKSIKPYLEFSKVMEEIISSTSKFPKISIPQIPKLPDYISILNLNKDIEEKYHKFLENENRI